MSLLAGNPEPQQRSSSTAKVTVTLGDKKNQAVGMKPGSHMCGLRGEKTWV